MDESLLTTPNKRTEIVNFSHIIFIFDFTHRLLNTSKRVSAFFYDCNSMLDQIIFHRPNKTIAQQTTNVMVRVITHFNQPNSN